MNNGDNSQGMAKCLGNEIIIKEEVEDEHFDFLYITGEKRLSIPNSNSSNGISESDRGKKFLNRNR